MTNNQLFKIDRYDNVRYTIMQNLVSIVYTTSTYPQCVVDFNVLTNDFARSFKCTNTGG